MEQPVKTMQDFIPDVNRILQGDVDCEPYVPMKLGEEEKTVSKAFQDGIVFAKLLNVLTPGAVDMADINLNQGEEGISFRFKRSNVKKAYEAAVKLALIDEETHKAIDFVKGEEEAILHFFSNADAKHNLNALAGGAAGQPVAAASAVAGEQQNDQNIGAEAVAQPEEGAQADAQDVGQIPGQPADVQSALAGQLQALMKKETLKAEKQREEEKALMMEAIEKKLKEKLDAMKELSMSNRSRSSRASRSSRSAAPKKVRLKLIFGESAKRVPTLPKTLEELRTEVQAYIEQDPDVKAHLQNSDQYVLTYLDDAKETLKICADKDLTAAYDDGLEAEGGILKLFVNPEVKVAAQIQAQGEGSNAEIDRLLADAQKIKDSALAEAEEIRLAAQLAQRAAESPLRRPSSAGQVLGDKKEASLGGLQSMIRKLTDAELPRPEEPRSEPIRVLEQRNATRSPGGRFLRQQAQWTGGENNNQKVYRAIESSTWREVCWTELTVTEAERPAVIDQVNMMKRFENTGMFNFIDGWISSENPNVIFIITEYLTGQDLAYALQNNKHQTLEVTRKWCLEILKSLGESHKEEVYHEDLSHHKIIVQRGSGKVKMHGKNSTIIKSGKGADAKQVIPQIAPPKEKMDPAKAQESDVVGFGLIVLHMLTSRCTDLPPDIMEPANYLDKARREDEDLKIQEKLQGSLKRIQNEDVIELITQCLDSPQKVNVEQLLQSKFFTASEDYDKLIEELVEVAEKKAEPVGLKRIEEESGDESSASDGNRLAYIQDLPEYQKEAENQSGPSTNLLDSYFKKLGKDQRINIVPKFNDHTRLAGLLVLKFDSVDKDTQKKTSRAMQGTGALYHRISETFFVIVTAAHNFIQFEETLGNKIHKSVDEAQFFLQMNGDKYKFRFTVRNFKAYPNYYDTQTFMYGDDVALAVVELDQDKVYKKNEHLLNKIRIPPPIFFGQGDEGEIKSSLFRVLGYPIETWTPKKQGLEKNLNKLYLDEGAAEKLTRFNLNDTGILMYGYDKICTTKGMSGCPIQMVGSTGRYKTVGVHVGNIDNKNFSVIFVWNLFLDFLIPTLEDFQEQRGRPEDKDKYSRVIEKIKSDYSNAFFLRELQRGENELERNKEKQEQKEKQYTMIKVKKIDKELKLSENIQDFEKKIEDYRDRGAEIYEKEKSEYDVDIEKLKKTMEADENYQQALENFNEAKQKFDDLNNEKEESKRKNYDESDEEDTDQMFEAKLFCLETERRLQKEATYKNWMNKCLDKKLILNEHEMLQQLDKTSRTLKLLQGDLQEMQKIYLKDPQQSSVFSYNEWTRVRFIPESFGGWDSVNSSLESSDKLNGNEEYGDASKDKHTWAKKFDDLEYDQFKVESVDKTSYSKTYDKASLQGQEMDSEELLGNLDLIKKYKGVNVYIRNIISQDHQGQTFLPENAIDGNSQTNSKTNKGEEEYWTATFVIDPKKIGVDTILIKMKDKSSYDQFKDKFEISIDQQEFQYIEPPKIIDGAIQLVQMNQNPIVGSAVKIQTKQCLSLELVSIELNEKIYREKKDIIDVLDMFTKFQIDPYDDPETQKPDPLKQIEDFKYQYNNVGQINIHKFIGNGYLQLLRDGENNIIRVDKKVKKSEDKQKNSHVKILSGQLNEVNGEITDVIGIGRSIELYTEIDEDENINRYISISLQEGLFTGDGKLAFGREIKQGKQRIGYFQNGQLHGYSKIYDENARLLYQGLDFCFLGRHIDRLKLEKEFQKKILEDLNFKRRQNEELENDQQKSNESYEIEKQNELEKVEKDLKHQRWQQFDILNTISAQQREQVKQDRQQVIRINQQHVKNKQLVEEKRKQGLNDRKATYSGKFKLLDNDRNQKNMSLTKILQLFLSRPDFAAYHVKANLTTDSAGTLSQLQQKFTKEGFLNIDSLLNDGFVFVERHSNDTIQPSTTDIDQKGVYKDYIRQGQLNELKMINGLGRKVVLKPKRIAKEIISFEDEGTFIEEGQFRCVQGEDRIIMGRRMIQDGRLSVGWFIDNAQNVLHGYGREIKLIDDRKTALEGLFEKGQKKDKDDVVQYDVENEFIAQKIIWNQYLLFEETQRDQIKKMQQDFEEDIKKAREKEAQHRLEAPKLLTKDFETKDQQLLNLLHLFTSKPRLGDLSRQPLKILELILTWSTKYLNLIGKLGMIDAEKLLNKGLMIIKRDDKENVTIVPLAQSMDINENEIIIKEGQIDPKTNKLFGLGRKIKIVGNLSKRQTRNSVLFDESNTFIEEGDFKNDQFDDTFGRVIMVDGAYRFGWFQGNNKFLHGYALKFDGKIVTEGLFERGTHKSKEQIMTFDGTDDFIAQKILLNAYVIQNIKPYEQKIQLMINDLRKDVAEVKKKERVELLNVLEHDQIEEKKIVIVTKNEDLKEIINLLEHIPQFENYDDFGNQTRKCILSLQQFKLKIVANYGLLNAKWLIQNGFMIVQRDSEMKVCKLSMLKDEQKIENKDTKKFSNTIIIKKGQITEKKLTGLGRKFKLKPILDSKSQKIIGFKEQHSYIEEGQFIHDELDGTFGRRMTMAGKSQIGWFQGDGRFLHGYGQIFELNKKLIEGLFEDGFFKKSDEVSEFVPEIDFIAMKINFDGILKIQEAQDKEKEVENTIQNISVLMKKAKRDKRISSKAFITDLTNKFEENNERLRKLVGIFSNRPDFGEYSDIKMHAKESSLKQLQDFSNKIIKKEFALNGKSLVMDAQIIVKRKEQLVDSEIIPLTCCKTNDEAEQTYTIRIGQMDQSDSEKLNGIGRKIKIAISERENKDDIDKVKQFNLQQTYIDEGEFNKDKLDGTFGRRIYMSEDFTQIGWFLDNKLHGYCKKDEQIGLFENGTFTENTSKIKLFDPEIDLIALEVAFQKYILTVAEVKKHIKTEREFDCDLSKFKADDTQKNEDLQHIYNMFQSPPQFGDYVNLDINSAKCVKLLQLFTLKCVKESKLLDGKKLIENAILNIHRNIDGTISQYKERNIQINDNKDIIIRYGQLSNDNKLQGLGTKIVLKPLQNDLTKRIHGFVEQQTYVDQGQFNDDQLNGTFGRRIQIGSDGAIRTGWFIYNNGESILHGFGLDSSNKKPPGYFEQGKYIPKPIEIKQFDYEIDFCAHVIDVENFLVLKKEVNQEIERNISGLNSEVQSRRDQEMKLQLVQSEIESDNEVLFKIIEMFYTKINFLEYGDITQQQIKSLQIITAFNKIFANETKLLNAKKLINQGILVVKRDENNSIIPISDHQDKPMKNQVILRCGQLNSENKIDGLGRKVQLQPKGGSIIHDYGESGSFIEEGEFKNDNLDGTFGRRIQLKGNSNRIGWFLFGGDKLHGFGRDAKGIQGLFENGNLIKNPADLKILDRDVDFVAHNIQFLKYLESVEQVCEETTDLDDNLENKIQERREQLVNEVKTDIDNNNQEITKISSMLQQKADFLNYGDTIQKAKTLKQILNIQLTIAKNYGLYNTKKLLLAGLFVIQRDDKNLIVPYKTHKDIISQEEVILRSGQLDSQNKIHGIGRKIYLKPEFYQEQMIGFNIDASYIEEGQFKDDQLDSTFGRRIYMNGNYLYGHFSGNGSQLNGYGKDSKTGKQGLFENGTYQNNVNQIKLYDYEKDFIGVVKNLDEYLDSVPSVIKDIEDIQSKLHSIMRQGVDKEIKQLNQDIKNNNTVIKQVCELFYSKPNFDKYGDESTQCARCLKCVLQFTLRFLKDVKLLNAMKLLQNGLIQFKRDGNGQIIQYQTFIDKISSDEIQIRYGQLDSENKLDGIGRKINLKLNKYGEQVVDFDKSKTFIEEGQFIQDEINGTFGRKVYLKEGSRIGWFQDGDKLHGYGDDSKNQQCGYFEEGEFKETEGEIKWYDTELDQIGHKISFSDYYEVKDEMIKEIQESIVNLPEKMKQQTEINIKQNKEDMDSKDQELTDILNLFNQLPDFQSFTDIIKRGPACLKLVLDFQLKYIDQCKLLNVSKLLIEGIITMSRNDEENQSIIGFSTNFDESKKETQYIRYGQMSLESNSTIHGLGRKIVICPSYNGEIITDFSETSTYIEEGQFKVDELDGTFGRRVYIKNGSHRIGWFKKNGSNMHGYGKDFSSSNEGLWEEGTFFQNQSQIKWYDIELDTISKRIIFDDYVTEDKDLLNEVNTDIKNMSQKIKEPYELAIKQFKSDLEAGNSDLIKLINIFMANPDTSHYENTVSRRIEWLNNFFIRIADQGFLNAQKLMEQGFFLLERDKESNEISPVEKPTLQVSDSSRWLRYGQMIKEKIQGLGRKLHLRHYSDEYYYDSRDYDWLEEGQFKNDKMNGFGRKIWMNTSYEFQMGWFQDNSLQGYGRKGNSDDQIGFYQNGDLFRNESDITQYSTEIDWVSQKYDFPSFFLSKEELKIIAKQIRLSMANLDLIEQNKNDKSVELENLVNMMESLPIIEMIAFQSMFLGHLYDMITKIYDNQNFFNIFKLMKDQIIILKRNDQNKIIPIRSHIERPNSELVILKYGQLNDKNQINGIGRKISINQQFTDGILKGFDQESSFIEEGEFNNDYLDKTFGRKFFHSSSNYLIGYFKQVDKLCKLNGFGKSFETNQEGLYEKGEFREDSKEIKDYDPQQELFAEEIDFNEYIYESIIDTDEFMYSKSNIAMKVKEMRTELCDKITMVEKNNLDIFQTLPEFNDYDEITLLTPMCYKRTLQFKKNYITQKFISLDKLISQRKIKVTRNDLDEIIPVTEHEEKVSSKQIIIRHGQLDKTNLLHGLGRKCTLKVFSLIGDKIVDYDQDETFIEDGEFVNDYLDGTFGRKFYFNGSQQFGWFTDKGTKLHGYGKDSTLQDDIGHFELGKMVYYVQMYDSSDIQHTEINFDSLLINEIKQESIDNLDREIENLNDIVELPQKTAIELLNKDYELDSDNQNKIQQLLTMISQIPEFDEYENFRIYSEECITKLIKFKEKIALLGSLNGMKLLEEGILIIERNQDNQVIDLQSDLSKENDEKDITIRKGQSVLEGQKCILKGLGRKIYLSAITSSEAIVGYHENISYLEEGQFINDKLENTFGRKLFMDGNYSFGWFIDQNLHGYGYQCEENKENEVTGLFEEGKQIQKHLVKWYDLDLDLIAKPIEFSQYVIIDSQKAIQISKDLQNIPLLIKEAEEQEIKLIKKDIEEKHQNLMDISNLFQLEPKVNPKYKFGHDQRKQWWDTRLISRYMRLSMLDIIHLVKDSILILTRDSNQAILPCELQYDSNDTSHYMRYGQIKGKKMIGVGRRIYLRHYSSNEYYYDSASYDYIEEGQFKNDKLNGFGRKFFMNSQYDTKLGWFQNNDQHGYGKCGTNEGWYQDGSHYNEKSSITRYEPDNNKIGKIIKFDDYYVPKDLLIQVVVEKRKEICKLDLIQKEIELNDQVLLKLIDMFNVTLQFNFKKIFYHFYDDYLAFYNQKISEFGFFDAKQLMLKLFIIVKRDEDENVVPFSDNYWHGSDPDQVEILQGQLQKYDKENKMKIEGIGRRIFFKISEMNNRIKFNSESYVSEGQFVDNELVFGRKFDHAGTNNANTLEHQDFGSGTTSIGWFKNGQLHGYGRYIKYDENKCYAGIFYKNQIKSKDQYYDIQEFNPEIDFISIKIKFQQFMATNEQYQNQVSTTLKDLINYIDLNRQSNISDQKQILDDIKSKMAKDALSKCLYQMLDNEPDFGKYSKQEESGLRCVQVLTQFRLKCLTNFGKLKQPKLIEDGLLVIKTQQKKSGSDTVVEYKQDFDYSDKKNAVIRSGQLNSLNQLDGLGRKIILKPIFFNEVDVIKDFEKESCMIEGEFKNDYLNMTFGRKIYFDCQRYKLGWFYYQNKSDVEYDMEVLHGYGINWENLQNQSEGLFEFNKIKIEERTIKFHDSKVDFIIKKVQFEEFLIQQVDLIENKTKIEQELQQIPQRKFDQAEMERINQDNLLQNEHLNAIINVLNSKPKYGVFDNIDQPFSKCQKQLCQFNIKIITENGLFDARSLLSQGILTLARQSDANYKDNESQNIDNLQAIIPTKYDYIDKKSVILIRHGQLFQVKQAYQIHGIGRKIVLNKEIIQKTIIIGFDLKSSYIEEGQFVNDEIDNTFGRRIYMKGGNKMGWFKKGGILHGYSHDLVSKQKGLFQSGNYILKSAQIDQYDLELDKISQDVEFDNYIVLKQYLISAVKEENDSLIQRKKDFRLTQNNHNLTLNELESNESIIQICEMMKEKPKFDILGLSPVLIKFFYEAIKEFFQVGKGYLDCKSLIQDSYIVLKRRSDKSVIGSSNHLQIESNEKMIIRQGQLNDKFEVNGIGRKVYLVPKNVNYVVQSLNDSQTYLEEGQFINDQIKGTFGRKIFLNKTNLIGWFNDDLLLHGYGRQGINAGCYEQGKIFKQKAKIQQYDILIDFIAQKIEFDQYYLNCDSIESEIQTMIDNLPQDIQASRDEQTKMINDEFEKETADENLMELINTLQGNYDLCSFGDVNLYTDEEIKIVQDFSFKCLSQSNRMNPRKLLQTGYYIIRRDINNQIIPLNKYCERIQSNQIIIRYGQLNLKNKLYGIGVKINLSTKNYPSSDTIQSLTDECYIEEGQFVNDQLDKTFGRKLGMDKSYKTGWFINNGDLLHGYGMSSSTNTQGHFENGIFKESSLVGQYDIINDFRAIDFTKIAGFNISDPIINKMKVQLKQQITNLQAKNNTSSQLRSKEQASFKNKMENLFDNKELNKLIQMFSTQPYVGEFGPKSEIINLKCINTVQEMLKTVVQKGLMNAENLCRDGIMIVQQDSQNKDVPLNEYVDTDERNNSYIRQGQLRFDHSLHGLGRKFTFNNQYKDNQTSVIKSFGKKMSFYEEGQFNYDQLDGTFGRRINFDGKMLIGWFQSTSTQLHGYGQNLNDKIGLFESGSYILDNSKINQYNPETSFKAVPITFSNYLIMEQQAIIEQIDADIEELNSGGMSLADREEIQKLKEMFYKITDVQSKADNKDMNDYMDADGYYKPSNLKESIEICLTRNKYFNLEALLESEYLILRDDNGNIAPYLHHAEFKKDETSGYSVLWLRYGQIDDQNRINGIGRRIRIDDWNGRNFAERWCYIEDGQFVDDYLQGFGRRIMMWNTDWKNRIGWGKDNGERGKTADNFKLEGLGRKYDVYKDGSGELGAEIRTDEQGLFENDESSKNISDLNIEDKDKIDNGTFDKWLLTIQEVEVLRKDMIEC